MMNFASLKSTINIEVFNLLLQILNNPQCDIYIPNYNNIINPFDNAILDSTDISQDDYIYLATIDCVYTYDKMIVKENDTNLGGKYLLIIYLRYDDITNLSIENIQNIKIKFNNILYSIVQPMNLYNILYEIQLSDN